MSGTEKWNRVPELFGRVSGTRILCLALPYPDDVKVMHLPNQDATNDKGKVCQNAIVLRQVFMGKLLKYLLCTRDPEVRRGKTKSPQFMVRLRKEISPI